MVTIKKDRKGLYLNLSKTNDADIIKKLDEQKNKQGYIKDLIRTDIDLDMFRKGFEDGCVKVVENGQCDNNSSEGR